jgi:hypothetical protein
MYPNQTMITNIATQNNKDGHFTNLHPNQPIHTITTHSVRNDSIPRQTQSCPHTSSQKYDQPHHQIQHDRPETSSINYPETYPSFSFYLEQIIEEGLKHYKKTWIL